MFDYHQGHTEFMWLNVNKQGEDDYMILSYSTLQIVWMEYYGTLEEISQDQEIQQKISSQDAPSLIVLEITENSWVTL